MKYILLSLLFTLTLSAKDDVLLVTEIFPPFQYKVDEQLVGVSVEVVKKIQEAVESTSKIKTMPWTRAVKMVDVKKNAVIFSMLRTKERENRYKWVGPLTSMQLVFFKKKGSNIVINSLEDAKKVKRIGVARKVANYEMLKAKGFTNLVPIKRGQDEQNLQLLAKGRIDLWPTLLMAGIYNAKLRGLNDQVEPIRDVVAFEGEMYLAFNKKSDDALIQKWQNALEKLKREHVIEKIIKKYK